MPDYFNMIHSNGLGTAQRTAIHTRSVRTSFSSLTRWELQKILHDADQGRTLSPQR